MGPWPILGWRPTGTVWEEEESSDDFCGGQVKSEIRCGFTWEGVLAQHAEGLVVSPQYHSKEKGVLKSKASLKRENHPCKGFKLGTT